MSEIALVVGMDYVWMQPEHGPARDLMELLQLAAELGVPVIAQRAQVAELCSAGIRARALPHGGPQRGTLWVERTQARTVD